MGLETIEVMRTLKRSLDPLWLMNPGKIFDAVEGQVNVEGGTATAAAVVEKSRK